MQLNIELCRTQQREAILADLRALMNPQTTCNAISGFYQLITAMHEHNVKDCRVLFVQLFDSMPTVRKQGPRIQVRGRCNELTIEYEVIKGNQIVSFRIFNPEPDLWMLIMLRLRKRLAYVTLGVS